MPDNPIILDIQGEDGFILDMQDSEGLDFETQPYSKGDPGKSAYQVAVDNGFVGTEEEWLASLVGAQGSTGADGFSPTATVTKSGTVATITITDKNGTTTATVNEGVTDYSDLTNRPTKLSDFADDLGSSPTHTHSQYLTSYTETDPVFTASVAHGITSADISNWNGKSDFSGDYDDLSNKPTIPADLWEQGIDSNNQPVPGAIKSKDFTYDGTTFTNTAPYRGAFVAGGGNTATGSYVVIAGCNNTANATSTVFGYNNTAAGAGGSTLIGNSNQATSGSWGFAAGVRNTISGSNTVAMGYQNTASNYNAVAMGNTNTASGKNCSVALGYNNTSSGLASIAVGYQTTASASGAHSEGRSTTASGQCAHTEGWETEASGNQAHAEGHGTQATARYNHVFGEYNISDSGFTAADARGTYIEIVGNGDDAQNRSNARTLDWNGNEWVAGLVSVGSSSTPPTPTANNHLTTKKYVDDIVGNIETLLASI